MTNEDKAFAIANDMTLPWVNLETPYEVITNGCIKMAEWKDQQFEQQREKLIDDILGVIKKELGEHIGKGLGLYHGELLNLDARLVVIEEGIKKIKQQL